MNCYKYLILFVLLSLHAAAQIGGSNTYQFLDLTASARVAALGGTFIAVKDNDLNLALQNPSLLNPSMDGQMAFSGVSYFGGIKYGDAAFAFDEKKTGTFMAAIHYVDYGTFQETDNTSGIIGNFKASEYAISVGWAHPFADSLFSIGAQVRFIGSQLYLYTSYGLAGDISATYYDKDREWTVAIVARNIGSQLKTYSIGDNEPLPTEVIAAVSKRLEHVPFRFTVTARHLEQWDISYLDPTTAAVVNPITGETTYTSISFTDKLARHFIFAGEILISKNFHLRVAYNDERKAELSIPTASSTAGFSFGFGLRINRFQLSYGRAIYSIAGGSDFFSISTNIHDFIN